jgi:imidazolonepropionase-like amidohydrolase
VIRLRQSSKLLLLSALPIVMRSESIIIKNVHLHPITSAEISSGEILIENGKIADFGKRVNTRGAQAIEGSGLHLYPGMINAATNIGLAEIGSVRDTVDVDEMGEFNPQLAARFAFNPASGHIEVTRAAGITTVLSLPGGSDSQSDLGHNSTVFAGQGAVMHLDGWTWDGMTVKPGAVLEMNFPEIEMPSPPAANRPGKKTKGFEGFEKQYKRKLADIDRFMDEARRYEKAKTAGNPDFKPDPKLEAMIPVLAGTRPILVRASRERVIKAAVEFADKQKVKIVIADPAEIGSTGPLLKSHKIPVVLGDTLELPLHDDDPYDSRYTLPNEFYKAGVTICFGTFDVQFARNLPFQAAAAVAFGLPYEEALKAVTINAAEILGVGDQIGSLEKGKSADFVLTDGDPLEAKTKIRMEFIAGRRIDLETRQTRLYEKYMGRP